MPYTVPLKSQPSAYPSSAAPIVDANGRPTPEFYTLIIQLRDWLQPADAALRQVEP